MHASQRARELFHFAHSNGFFLTLFHLFTILTLHHAGVWKICRWHLFFVTLLLSLCVFAQIKWMHCEREMAPPQRVIIWNKIYWRSIARELCVHQLDYQLKSHGPETINLTNGRMGKRRRRQKSKRRRRWTDFLIKLLCAVTWKLRSRGVIADHFAIDANVHKLKKMNEMNLCAHEYSGAKRIFSNTWQLNGCMKEFFS